MQLAAAEQGSLAIAWHLYSLQLTESVQTGAHETKRLTDNIQLKAKKGSSRHKKISGLSLLRKGIIYYNNRYSLYSPNQMEVLQTTASPELL